jgi:hypothetical protein
LEARRLVLLASSRQPGRASSPTRSDSDIRPLYRTFLEFPGPKCAPWLEASAQVD